MFLTVSLGMACLLAVLSSLMRADVARGIDRLRDLTGPEESPAAGRFVGGFLAKAGAILLPSGERQRARLEARLTQAGIRTPGAASAFLGAKLILVSVLPVVAGLALYL